MKIRSVIAMLALTVLGSGCGYTLQNSQSPLADKEGIRKIYVYPLVNNTYTPGVENTLYNALIRTLSVHRRVVLVSRPEDADAVLKGNVTFAFFGPSAQTTANQLYPIQLQPQSGDPLASVLVATEYTATLSCSFTLVRPNPGPSQRSLVWSSSFTRAKPFNASNQLGTQGDTSALINQSEFERSLSDLATSMMGDVHENMLAMF